MTHKTAGRLTAFFLTLTILISAAPALCFRAGAVPAEIRGVTVSKVLGMDDSRYIAWLESHENDSYYIGTPYAGYDHRNPNGDCQDAHGAEDEPGVPGMNCSGFVWHALYVPTRESGGKVEDIPYPGGMRWYDFYINNTISRRYFSSKEEMLQSGYLSKGDLIWMYVDGEESQLNDYHHVGIYWGDGKSDKMWSSTVDYDDNLVGNGIAPIRPMLDRNTLYAVIKVTASEQAMPTTRAKPTAAAIQTTANAAAEERAADNPAAAIILAVVFTLLAAGSAIVLRMKGKH